MGRIITPATSANMASGFDTFGLAVTMHNQFIFKEHDEYIFQGKKENTYTSRNLILTSMLRGFEIIGKKPVGVVCYVRSGVPATRGLGSSATCVTAGIAMAFELSGVRVNKNDIFYLSSKIEGHPDNVAPCIYGGMTIAYKEGSRFKYYKIAPHPKYKLMAFIPEFKLATKESRGVLPEEYPVADVVYNIQRAALLPVAIRDGRNKFLQDALGDKLHEPYRKSLIPGYERITKITQEEGFIGTYLSGAGPTIMGIYEQDKVDLGRLKKRVDKMKNKYLVKSVDIDKDGLQIVK